MTVHLTNGRPALSSDRQPEKCFTLNSYILDSQYEDVWLDIKTD